MMLFYFSESGRYYGYGKKYGYKGYGYKGYGYKGYGYKGYGYGKYGKRGMKKMASHQGAVANDVHAELNDEAKIEHLKENFAEVKPNKAQLKALH